MVIGRPIVNIVNVVAPIANKKQIGTLLAQKANSFAQLGG
jgi:hypothetical protein